MGRFRRLFVRRVLPPHDHFAEMVAREEKLDGLEILEQPLQAPVVEELRRPAPPARDHSDGVVVRDSVRVGRDSIDALLGVKEREHASARPQHAMKALDERIQQRDR